MTKAHLGIKAFLEREAEMGNRTAIGSVHDAYRERIAELEHDVALLRDVLRDAREWMNQAVGESWAVHDRVDPPLFDRIDAALQSCRSWTPGFEARTQAAEYKADSQHTQGL